MAKFYLDSITCKQKDDKLLKGKDEILLILSDDNNRRVVDIHRKMKKGEEKKLSASFNFKDWVELELWEYDGKRRDTIDKQRIKRNSFHPMQGPDYSDSTTLSNKRARYIVNYRVHIEDNEQGKY